MKKLYVVVDQALDSGLKMAQAIHAAIQFGQENPGVFQQWYTESNNIVVLQAGDVPELTDELVGAGLRVSRFHEPDLAGALTAFCVEPAARSRLSDLSLAS